MRTIHLAAVMGLLIAWTCPGFAQDVGDQSSSALTSMAWAELEQGKFGKALLLTKRCVKLYEAEAVAMQKKLTDFAPAETANEHWALNDVGTCMFIEGQVREKQGQTRQAIAAYKKLVDTLGYAQCWDPKGWFWRPAEAAETRAQQLEFEAAMEGEPDEEADKNAGPAGAKSDTPEASSAVPAEQETAPASDK